MSEYKSRISKGQNVFRGRDKYSEYQNLIHEAVKTALKIRVSGPGLRLSQGPGGTTIYDTRKEQKSGIYFAVVRSVGTGEEHFITIQQITPSKTSPWDGTWKAWEDAPFKKVSCFPGLKSAWYSQYVWRRFDNPAFPDEGTPAVTIETPIVEVVKDLNGIEIAMQSFKLGLPLQERTPNFLVTDCTPLETVTAQLEGLQSTLEAVKAKQVELIKQRQKEGG